MAGDSYQFENTKRGKALIMCNENFGPDTGRGQRPGATKDLEYLTMMFSTLGFVVRFFTDLSSTQMIKEVKRLSKEDHSASDCVAVVISSHGSHDECPSKTNYGMEDVDFVEDVDMLYGTDTAFEVERLTEVFSESNCPSLKGKPKLFFFQGCRGEEFAETVKVGLPEVLPEVTSVRTNNDVSETHTLDGTHVTPHLRHSVARDEIGKDVSVSGHKEGHSELFTDHDDRELRWNSSRDAAPVPRERIVTRKVIISRDYLTMWSCPAGYFAFHTSEGSPFIRILCEVLLAQHHEDDLLTMLTEVNRRVATEYESHTEEEYSNKRRIVPSIEHMLRKQVYLT